ncbi:hypothetical protein ACFQU9_46125 [Actinomadura namibiensis]|uniref:Uncharacterized protein n=1 Tax=Actinomadura namibiensis TaxID=182080 RepID=A0A7W3LUN4_ACTNM|nr:hypothetical protein [Actinomadura namibiensis]MBA8954633.1 hypothetical protein [Actinomadura namibiensis]
MNEQTRRTPAKRRRPAILVAASALILTGGLTAVVPAAGAATAAPAATADAPKPPPTRAAGQRVTDTADCAPSSLDARSAKAKPVTDPRTPRELRGKKVISCVQTNVPNASRESADARAAALAAQRGRAGAPDEETLRTRLKTAQAARKGDKDARAKLADNIPLPDWCHDHAFDGWWVLRTAECQIADITVLYFAETNGRRVHVGTAKALEFSYNYTSSDIDTFASQIRVVKYWGERAGSTDFFSNIYGWSTCSGDCKQNSDSGLRPGRFARDVNNDGQAFYDNTRTETGGIGYATPTWHWFVHLVFFLPSTTRNQPDPPRIRCDNAFSTDGNDLGDPASSQSAGVIGNGCVVPSYVPTWIVLKNGLYPTVAYHVEAAQKSGLPGAYPNGPVLHRLQDSAKKRQNGDTACPPAPTWVRPAGKSCDEYPMRSTYEGASTAPAPGTARSFAPPTQNVPGVGEWCEMDAAWNVPTGVTGPTGWSSCMLPARDNSGAGALLGGFYKSNRVLDNDPFLVWPQ